MEYLVTREEMRAYDTYTIEYMGIPSLVLMERAALKAVARIEEVIKRIESDAWRGVQKKANILCVCGTGNNGGDGLCVARLLREKNIPADAVLVGSREKLTKETAHQLSVLEKYNANIFDKVPQKEYAIIVDALFGIGLSGDICQEAKAAIEAVNDKEAYRIALDIPSGIDADTGKVWGVAVKAHETVAIAFRKRGHCLYPGSLYTGKVRVADIGITERSFNGKLPGMYTFTEKAKDLLPERIPYGNKGSFGKLLIVAGSAKMAGAALLCAESAYRTGAGMVKLVIPETIREIVQSRLPEALIQTYQSAEELTKEEESTFMQNTDWADVIAIGPGLSVCGSGYLFLKDAVQSSKPLLIDADGLNMLDQREDLWIRLQKRGTQTVLTPHMGELARLLQKSVSEVVTDETAAVCELAEKSGCIVVGKSARTHVCKSGSAIFLNTAGNDKMATAGSGDVLAGVITALMAHKRSGHGVCNEVSESIKNAACLGVFLHACAGDIAAQKAGNAGIMASDIINSL